MQKKRKFYPTMADTSFEFSNLHLPASRYVKELNISSSREKTPLSGMRYNKQAKMFASPNMEPAGKRVPTQYIEE